MGNEVGHFRCTPKYFEPLDFITPYLQAWLGVLILWVSMIITTIVVWPCVTTMTRLFANYIPTSSKQKEGNWLTGGWHDVQALISRVRRVEGISGFWRGIVLGILYANFMFLYILLTVVFFPFTHKPFIPITIITTLSFFILSIPFRIILIRIVVSGRSQSLKSLLTTTERTNPFRLLRLPGVIFGFFAADLSFGLLTFLHFGGAHWVYLSMTPFPFEMSLVASLLSGLCFGLQLSLAWIVVTRLALQRLDGESESETEAEEAKVPNTQEDLEKSTSDMALLLECPVSVEESEMVTLRPTGTRSDQLESYKGFFNCIKRLEIEEGKSAGFRTWSVTAFSFFFVFFFCDLASWFLLNAEGSRFIVILSPMMGGPALCRPVT